MSIKPLVALSFGFEILMTSRAHPICVHVYNLAEGGVAEYFKALDLKSGFPC